MQYCGLASQQGEIDGEMALSTRFLCGAEGKGASRGRGARVGLEGIGLARMWYTQLSRQCASISVWSTLIVASRQRWQRGNDRQPRRSQPLYASPSSRPSSSVQTKTTLGPPHPTSQASTRPRSSTSARIRNHAPGAIQPPLSELYLG